MCIIDSTTTNYLIYEWNIHSQENEVKEGQSDYYLIEFMEGAKLEIALIDEEYQNTAYEYNAFPNSRDFKAWYPWFKHVETSRP